MVELMQQIANGLVMGSYYVLIALGLTLIFGILQIPHLAHGAVAVFGGYIAWYLVTSAGLNFFVALILSMVATAGIGILFERLTYNPVRNAPPINSFIIALGLLILLQNLMTIIFSPNQVMIRTGFDGIFKIGDLRITNLFLVLFVISILIVLLLFLFIKYTKLGKAIQAVSQNPEASSIVGINIKKIRIMVFGIGSAIAAASGAFMASIFSIYPTLGELVVMKAFVVIILGGLGSFPGAIVGGLIIGLTESLGGWLISSHYKDVYSFALMILLLIFRPQGLFGGR